MSAGPAAGRSETPGPAATPRTRRKARHILDNWFIGPARDPAVLEIWAYTDRTTYRPGETVELRVSTTAARYDLTITREAPVAPPPVLSARALPGRHCDTPPDCAVRGCGWPVAFSFTIGQDWVPGAYLLTLTAWAADGADHVEEHHLILVLPAHGRPRAPILLLCATPSWVAYNCWGGSNSYDGICGADGLQPSPVLSLERPWTRGFCRLPAGAPRTVPEHPPRPGEMVRYPYMEWAYAYGYSKKYASAGWASYERHFALWAEAAGYRLEIATLHDLERDPALLEGCRCAVIVGHDEYWSGAMRDVVEAWIQQGGRVARFAADFLWQVRMEADGTRQICHKLRADRDDPVAGTADQALLTGAWESASVNRPGALTFGVNGLRGIYAHLGNTTPRGAGGFTIYRPEHWSFAGSGLGYGDVLGAGSRVFGYEVDGLDLVIRDGLPYATGRDGASPDIQILAVGLAANTEPDRGIWGEVAYLGDGEALWRAQVLEGVTSPEAIARASRGNGVIIHWQRGAGEVWCAAACEWVMGLTRGDRQIEQVTRTVLDRFSTAPAPPQPG